jgi:hypothetical protein
MYFLTRALQTSLGIVALLLAIVLSYYEVTKPPGTAQGGVIRRFA